MNRRGFLGSLAALLAMTRTAPKPTPDFGWHEVGWHYEHGRWTYYTQPLTIAPAHRGGSYYFSSDGVYLLTGRGPQKISRNV